MLVAVVVVCFGCSCGARTGLGVTDAVADVSPDVVDASVPEAPAACDFGAIVTDVFGASVWWSGGVSLPPGHYRIAYVDGCMKYSAAQDWSVNAYGDGPDTFFVVSGNSTLGPAPGTVGFLQGQGGFATFADCVDANLAVDKPLEFDFAGGPLGIRLSDGPYTDNVVGENGRNPTYRLSSCP